MAQTKIYIYGAGGHGLVAAEVAKSNGYDEIIFLNDNSDMKFNPNLEKVDIFIAVGDNKTRQLLSKKVLEAGFSIVSLIDKRAVVSQSAKIEKGVLVMPNAVINAKATIKFGAIINSAAVIEHECLVGEFAHISPNVALAGNVSIGDLTHIGIGSCVIQNIKIGKNCIIGAGSVVVKDILDNSKAYGVPAKVKT